MPYRRAASTRRHRATAKQHNGNVDAHGTPTYTTSVDWTEVVTEWPCEMRVVSGGEVIRGKQVAAETSHVLFGEFHGGKAIQPQMKVEVYDPATSSTIEYGVVSSYDMDGDSRELRVELRREVD